VTLPGVGEEDWPLFVAVRHVNVHIDVDPYVDLDEIRSSFDHGWCGGCCYCCKRQVFHPSGYQKKKRQLD